MTLPEWFESTEKAYRQRLEWIVNAAREHCADNICEQRHFDMLMGMLGEVPYIDKAPLEIATPEEQANYLTAQAAGFKGEHERYKRQSRAVILGWYEREVREICKMWSGGGVGHGLNG